jgi:Flp pilus assembly protein TadB
MKRFVIAASKDWAVVVGAIFVVLIALTEPGMALLMFLCLGVGGTLMTLDEKRRRRRRR